MTIHCQERFDAARAYAKSVGLLEQFDSTINRLKGWEQNEYCPKEIHIGSDWAEHSFSFWEEYLREDLKGRDGICGGIIYHGCEKEGYRTGGSTMIAPSYGWHIHT